MTKMNTSNSTAKAHHKRFEVHNLVLLNPAQRGICGTCDLWWYRSAENPMVLTSVQVMEGLHGIKVALPKSKFSKSLFSNSREFSRAKAEVAEAVALKVMYKMADDLRCALMKCASDLSLILETA